MNFNIRLSVVCCLWLLLQANENIKSLALHTHQQYPSWIVNFPQDLYETPLTGQLLDVRNSSSEMLIFKEVCENLVWKFDVYTDGEIVDTLEHFFWGKKNGIALELGALDGSPDTRSMTFELENRFGWRRVLIEGNPNHRQNLKTKSSKAISINAGICQNHQTVHFADRDYVGGIVEFMSEEFLKLFYGPIYHSGLHPNQTFDLGRVPWHRFPYIHVIDCIPLHTVFSHLNLTHINFFILDVEGGEMNVLKSIHWHQIRFDILTIETDPPNRPPGYADQVIEYMKGHGYKPITGQLGRNIWFIHPSYEASLRPGLSSDCFNAFRRFEEMVKRRDDPKTPPFQPCPLSE